MWQKVTTIFTDMLFQFDLIKNANSKQSRNTETFRLSLCYLKEENRWQQTKTSHCNAL